MINLIREYKLSLKMPEAEEVFDLIFYRPLGFLFVKIIYPTPLTPNQVTLLSLLAGLFAAREFSFGGNNHFFYGALFYALANVLDCADGQLARLKKNGTLLGRVIDGAFDYVSSVAIFVGIGFGLSRLGESEWLLVTLAGVSSAVHALFFDHYQNEFISTVRGERNFLEREIEQFSELIDRTEGMKRAALQVYLRYLYFQQQANTRDESQPFDAALYRNKNSVMIRLWSLLGPTTNRTMLIVSALLGNIHYYLWIIIVGGNFWLIVCYFMQKRIHKKMLTGYSAAKGHE